MKKLIFFLLLPLIFNLYSLNAKADEPQTNLPFIISLELPSNQVKDTKGYFNLNVEPNHTQEIYVVLKNQAPQPISIDLKAANALTSIKGGIVYVEDRGSKVTSLTDESFYLDHSINLPKEIKLAGNEEKRVPITVTVPNKDTGTLLGGMLFTLKDAGSTKKESNEENVEFTVKNRLVYAIAIQLNLPTKTEELPLKVNNTEHLIFPSGNNIAFELENPNASIVNDVSYNYQVIDKKGVELFKGVIEPFNVAPKSKVSIPIPWNYDTYKKGDYQLVLKPSYSDLPIEKEFKIERKDIKHYAKTTGQKTSIPILDIPWFFWVLTVLVLIAFIYLAYRIGKSNSDKAIIKERVRLLKDEK